MDSKPNRVLGEKGTRTRSRLLAVTRAMLETVSPVQLTAAAIAQNAELSAGTFYIYFKDVQDILYVLAADACTALTDLYESHPHWFQDPDRLNEDAEQFVALSESTWSEHRQILIYRNLEADRGNERFSNLRSETASAILARITNAAMASHPKMSQSDAYATAVVLYAALERICAVKYHYPQGAIRATSTDHLRKAIARMIAQQLGSSGTDGKAALRVQAKA